MINELKHLHPNADPMVDFTLQDNSDGKGPFIAKWDTAKLGKQPTQAELDAVTIAANLAIPKAEFIVKIDRDVDKLISEVIGSRASEYELAEKEAKDYKKDNYPATPVPSSVSSWATAKGWTSVMATDSIIAAATGWRTAQMALRAERLLRKEQGRLAVDAGALDVVKADWVAFLAAIKAQLR